MKLVFILAQVLSAISICWAQSPKPQARLEAEYYVVAYAQHYRAPVALVRAIVERESHWRACAVSPKGAAGTNAVNAPNRSATRSKRPMQCRSKRFRGRAIPRMVDARIS